MVRSAARGDAVGLSARRGWVFFVVLLSVTACTGQTASERAGGPEIPKEAAKASAAADRTDRPVEPEQPVRMPDSQAEVPGPSQAAATLSAVSVPFGEGDLYLGARDDPGTVVVWPGPRDAQGALVSGRGAMSHIEPDAVGRVLDLCVREEAHAAIRGRILEPGEPIDYEALIWLRNSQFGLGCHGEPKSDDAIGRWFYLTPGGLSGYFDTREQAQQWRQDQRERYRNTLGPWGYPMGFINEARIEFTDEFGTIVHGIRYSDADDPIDEVRVLADTVAVRDGMLRGLVRNLSRALWAYGVTVGAEGKSWQWPLSIQPGGVAPFEIEGWDGSDDSDQIDLTVIAHMSPKGDVSRSYDWGQWNPLPPDRMPDFEQAERDDGHEPGIVQQIDADRWVGSNASFRVPASHPGFADHIALSRSGLPANDGQPFAADELVSYIAYMQWQVPEGGDYYEDGRSVVFEVAELPVFSTPGDMDVSVTWFASGLVSEMAWLGLPNPQIR